MSNLIKTDSVHLYSHTALNQYYDNEIRLYGIDKDRKNICLRIKNFKPYIYLEVIGKHSDEDIATYLRSNHYRNIHIKKEKNSNNFLKSFKTLRYQAIDEYKPIPQETPEILTKKELIEYVRKYRDFLPKFIKKNCWNISFFKNIYPYGKKEKLYYANGVIKDDKFHYTKHSCYKIMFSDANSIYNFVNVIKEDEGKLVYFDDEKKTNYSC